MKNINSILSENGLKATEIESFGNENLNYIITINNDGSQTLFDYGYPIKYVDSNTGEIEFIDYNFTQNNFIEKIFSGYLYKNTINTTTICLPNKINTGVLIEDKNYNFSIIPICANNSNPEVINTSDEEDCIQYSDSLDNGIHLQYSVNNSGLNNNIILKEYKKYSAIEFKIKSDDLIPRNFEGDEIIWYNPKDNTEYIKTSKIVMQDANSKETKLSYNNKYVLSKSVDQNNEYILKIILDSEYLASPDTQYPVTMNAAYSSSATNGLYGFYDATISAQQISDNDFSEQTFEVRAGSKMAYIKNYNAGKYKHINPEKINNVTYMVHGISQSAPETKISMDIPWTYHNIHTVTYETLFNNIHIWGSSYKTLSAISTDTTYFYSFDVTEPFKHWLKYELNEYDGWYYDIGFVLRADSGYRTFKSVENAATSERPSIAINCTVDTPIEEGIYTIKNRKSNNCLYVANGLAGVNSNILTDNLKRENSQEWIIQKAANGKYYINSTIDSTYSICTNENADINGNNIVLKNSKTPYWIISNNDGTYRIMWSTTRGINVDYSNGVDQKNVMLWTYNNGDNEKWVLEKPLIGYKGYAVYRDGAIGNSNWHGALMGVSSSSIYHPIIHITDPEGPVKTDSWDSFIDKTNNTYMGTYKPKKNMSESQRNNIVALARKLTAENITYTFFRTNQL